jgi:uroporphyrinogen-III synthase
MRLLVTRPAPDAARTAATLRARGHFVTVLPVLRVEAVADVSFGTGPFAAVLITSSNACHAVAAHKDFDFIRETPAFTVGRKSAAAARAAGFATVVAADGDAAALARLVAEKLKGIKAPLLYLAGEERAADLEGRLRQADLSVRTCVVYRTVADPEVTEEIAAVLEDGEFDAVMHYSARSAGAFLAAGETAGLTSRLLKIRHYCLSAQVAAPLLAAGADDVRVANEPNESALFDLIGA